MIKELETPSVDDKVQEVEEIEFNVELSLDDSKTTMSDNELSKKLETDLLTEYEKLNPFTDGHTKLTVVINTKTSKRKRRSSSSDNFKTALVSTQFKSTHGERIMWFKGMEFILKQNAIETTKGIKAVKDNLKQYKNGVAAVGFSLVTTIQQKTKFQLVNWMSYLSQTIKENVPLTRIAIPGSHNSATYFLRGPKTQEWPDKGGKKLVTESHLHRWGQCIKQNTYQQLELGLRYFDFR